LATDLNQRARTCVTISFSPHHVRTLQYVTSPGKENDPGELALPPNDNVLIAGAGYHIPLYGLGDSIDPIAGYATVDSGVVQNLFAINGSGQVYAARYNFGLPSVGPLEQKVALGFDWRIYNNDVALVGTSASIVPAYAVHCVRYEPEPCVSTTVSRFNAGCRPRATPAARTSASWVFGRAAGEGRSEGSGWPELACEHR
jgi:hypothetical protein